MSRDVRNHHNIWGLTFATIGVVYGDIGTGPLYVFKEVLHAGRDIEREMLIMGTLSLIFWAQVLVVSVKYMALVLRADHEGEGGIVALMALAQRATGQTPPWLLWVGLIGMSLFLIDGMMTPAISVLSAIEGFQLAPGIGHSLQPFVLPVSALILIGVFSIQPKGTKRIARFFSPIILIWFGVIAMLGLIQIIQYPAIVAALHPTHGWTLMMSNPHHALAVLGTLFLALTGAEAIYADLGHFGKSPIRRAWFILVFPALTLNYFGQGVHALHHIESTHPFFQMVPEVCFWPVLVLSALAAVIASQAVITGAFSLAQQASQMGYLPRLTVRQTSADASGQIYVPVINLGLFVGVMLLLIMFRQSSSLASAYGIAITVSMALTNVLLWVVARHAWGWSGLRSGCMLTVAILIDVVFVVAVLDEFLDGGWFTVGTCILISGLMGIWIRGNRFLSQQTDQRAVPLQDLFEIVQDFPPATLNGTGIFLTRFSDRAPFALVNNIKAHRVLHRNTVLLETHVAPSPRVDPAQRLRVKEVAPGFWQIQVRFGFMESMDVPQALKQLTPGLFDLDFQRVTYYVGRRSSVTGGNTQPFDGAQLPAWQHAVFAFMHRNAAHPCDFFHLPPEQVVEVVVRYRV